MTIDKEKLKALAERAVDDYPLFDHSMAYAAPAVLALLAEIDKLKAALDMESAELAWSDSDGREIQAERDKLRAELAGLRTGYDAQNEVIAELRKDAERYNWAICRVQCAEALSAVVICHYGYKEKINERVDAYMEAWPCPVAAMAKEASQ